ncbi:MAG: hypothetical protein AAF420_12635, partial [Pseudomonadota bacterium]
MNVFLAKTSNTHRAVRLVLLLGIIVSCTVVAYTLYDNLVPQPTSVTEQFLSLEEQRKIAQQRQIFGRENAFVVLHFNSVPDGNPSISRPEIQSALENFPEVKSAFAFEAFAIVEFDIPAIEFQRASTRTRELDTTINSLFGETGHVTVLGSTDLRDSAWTLSHNDFRTKFVPLLVIVVIVPVFFFRHWSACLLPLLLASTTLLATLCAMFVARGAISTLGLHILPFVFSVATLDAIHLLRATERGGTSKQRIARCVGALRAPCLVTSVTTIAGLLVLYAHSDVPYVREFALWCSVATGLAYALTFTLGRLFLDAAQRSRSLHERSNASLTERLVQAAQRHSRLSVAFWAVFALAAIAALPTLSIAPPYPKLYTSETSVQARLDQFMERTDIDPAPLDIVIRGNANT